MDSEIVVYNILLIVNEYFSLATQFMLSFTCKQFCKKLLTSIKAKKAPSCCGERPLLTSIMAYEGSFDLLRYFVKGGSRYNGDTLAAAARMGHSDMLRWLRWHEVCAKQRGLTLKVAVNAARGGHLRIVKWCLRYMAPSEEIAFNAARGGHIHLLKWWFCDRRLSAPPSIMAHAAEKGRGEALEWLLNYRTNLYHEKMFKSKTKAYFSSDWYDPMITVVTETPNFYCPYELTSNLYTAAASHGQSHIISWLREKNCPWDTDMLKDAVENQNISLVNWLLDNYAPFDDTIIPLVAKIGNFELLLLLSSRGVPLNKDQCLRVTNNPKIIEWIQNFGA